MSGIFGATVIPGNRITDFAKQTATVGTPIPFGYGKFPVTQTNVIWIDDVKEHVTKKKQGKGGVKTEEYTYTRSYAIGVCQGPVYGFLIIRRNGKVVYTEDPNAPIDDKTYAAKWRQSVQFYFGTRDQLPDSTIEAVEGAGQISAFRDVAYFVVENDDVTDGAGAVPSYEVVVMGTLPEVYVTSRPYALEVYESYQSQASPLSGYMFPTQVESLSASATFVAGELRAIVQNYDMGAEEYSAGATFVSGVLKQIIRNYDMGAEEYSAGATFVSGVLKQIVQNYDMGVEAYDAGATFTSGALT